MKALSVKKITKTFGVGVMATQVLKGVTFDVEKGSFVSVMGQSGSGKSTLLYAVSGIEPVTSGKVYLQEDCLNDLSDASLSDLRLLRMGFVFQHSYLLKKLSVRENILLPAYKARLKSASDVERDAEKLMIAMDIANVADRSIQNISGGQLQRAGICRALINEPDILFADEPTGALNATASADVMRILNRLNMRGMTILMATHDAKLAARTDRIIYLKDGLIADELHLGKYEGDQHWQIREASTLRWLIERGF